MADRPILFSGPMVRALIDGRKTQTRRVINPQPPAGARFTGVHYASDEPPSWFFNSPSGPHKVREAFEEGDRLWVRETWSHTGDGVFEIRQARIAPTGRVIYAASPAPGAPHAKYWPSIHMPREFSRLTLVVTEVRVERLQDISEADAIAEGCQPADCAGMLDHRLGYSILWDGLNAKRGFGWDVNPWVVAVTFTIHHQNIDALKAQEAA